MMKGNTGVTDIKLVDFIFMPSAKLVQEMSHTSFKKKKPNKQKTTKKTPKKQKQTKKTKQQHNPPTPTN